MYMQNEFDGAFLYENKIGIHTFEISKSISFAQYRQLAEWKQKFGSEQPWKDTAVCPGMRLHLVDIQYQTMIKIIVNPRLLRDSSQDEFAYYGITGWQDGMLKQAFRTFERFWKDTPWHWTLKTNADPQKALDRLLNAFFALKISPTPQNHHPYFLPSLPQITALACQTCEKMTTVG